MKIKKRIEYVLSFGPWLTIRGIFKLLYFYFLSKTTVKKIIIDVFKFKMYVDLEDKGLSRQLVRFGMRELDHKFILERINFSNKWILDIGANIGYYVLLENQIYDSAKEILAVEPMAKNFELLRKNIELNKLGQKIYPVRSAISDENGSAHLFTSTSRNLNTFHRSGTVAKHLDGGSEEVPVATIDCLLKDQNIELSDIGLVRMDIEGHEVVVLDSATILMHQNKFFRPYLVFEAHVSRYNQNNNIGPVINQLFRLGYKCSYLSSSGWSGSRSIKALGYEPIAVIKTDGSFRAIFQDVIEEHLIHLLLTGGVRTIGLGPR